MKALVLRDDAEAAAGDAQALIEKGFQVVCVETRKVAHALLRIDTVDLLIMEEQIDGRLTHALALSAERRNPYISTILMTDRSGEETDDLYDLIPSLYALAGTTIAPKLLGKLALSSIEDYEQIKARVQHQLAEDAAEEALDDEPPEDEETVTTDPLAAFADDELVAEDAAIEEYADIPDAAVAAHPAPDDTNEVPFDIPTYADAVEHAPELAEPDFDDGDVAALADIDDLVPVVHEEQDETITEQPTTAHLAQVSVIGEMRAARASFR